MKTLVRTCSVLKCKQKSAFWKKSKKVVGIVSALKGTLLKLHSYFAMIRGQQSKASNYWKATWFLQREIWCQLFDKEIWLMSDGWNQWMCEWRASQIFVGNSGFLFQILFIKIHRSQIQILTTGSLGDAFMLIWTWNMNFIWHTIYCDRIIFRVNSLNFHKKSLKNNHERLSVMAYKYSFINNSILKRKLNNIAVTFASKITNTCFWTPLVSLWRKSSLSFFPALALNLQV